MNIIDMREYMKIEKYQATGNDFLITDTKLNAQAIKKLCHRHYGIGSDGLIIYNQKTDYVTFYNQDGSLASLCGNGLRCLGLYLNRHFKYKNHVVNCLNNQVRISVLSSNEVKIFLHCPSNYLETIKHFNFDTLDYYTINIGNPHAIFILDDLNKIDQRHIDDLNLKLGKQKYNYNFVKITKKNSFQLLTYELGVGFTLSCGSGSLASAIILNRLGLISKINTVLNNGGNIKINLDELSLTSECQYIFNAEIEDNYERI